MRYKISFAMPWIDQKHILHAHSHLAFVGWVSHTLMVLIGLYIHNFTHKSMKRLMPFIILNLVAAYGMLISFVLSGYSLISIGFSTLSLVVFFGFAYVIWTGLSVSVIPVIVRYWIRLALICGMVSFLGTLSLAYMMAIQDVTEKKYLASTYFYLHFQYNGWFLFSCMALFFAKLRDWGIRFQHQLPIFWLFALSVLPAYILSTLWMPIPTWMYIIVILAAVAQVIALILFLQNVIKNRAQFKSKVNSVIRMCFNLSLFALTIKVLLQLGSVVPYLGNLAFGYRSIVIGYLHLALLGVITIFLLGYIVGISKSYNNKNVKLGIVIFLIGVILNELALMIQGVGGLFFIFVPYMNQSLFFIALILFSGILILNLSMNLKNLNEPDIIEDKEEIF